MHVHALGVGMAGAGGDQGSQRDAAVGVSARLD